MQVPIRCFVWMASLLAALTAKAQDTPFDLYLEPMSIEGLGGLQSYAYGQADGKWLIIGGRLDGLHRRQPFAAFDLAGHNTLLIVVDPANARRWVAPTESLAAPLREQLRSTNMQFYQQGDYLYLTGGYGYSALAADHTTFPYLTAVNVPAAIRAIQEGTPLAPHFRQITDPKFQVTGGHLKKIENTFYLIGGHKFLGRYNPQGPTHGPGFIQEYTHQIRPFRIYDDGLNLVVEHLSPITDSANLHRRDYNATAQIMPNGSEGITAFSGVFRPDADLPFLNCVNIDANGYAVNDSFQQYLNHYHCPVLPMYSASRNEMHSVFFGGIAQYYYDNAGNLIRDDDVPFVKTIARVTRNATGTMTEHKLPIEMPGLLGAGAEFIRHKSVPHYKNGVLQLDNFPTDTTLVGYIFGGINSSAPNIFFINTGTQSTASPTLFKVYVVRKTTIGTHQPTNARNLNLRVFPNPNGGNFSIAVYLNEKTDLRVSLLHPGGKRLKTWNMRNTPAGENTFQLDATKMQLNGTYILTVETPTEKTSQKVVIKP